MQLSIIALKFQLLDLGTILRYTFFMFIRKAF
jgi:hypothetical protein